MELIKKWIRKGSTTGISNPTSITLSAGTSSSTSIPFSITVTGGVLIDWDLQKSEDSVTWSTIASDITANTQIASGLTSNTEYKFKAIVRTSSESSATTTATTTELPPVSLTSWAQIDGGQDLGSPIDGGNAWFWNNSGSSTFESLVNFQEPATIDAVQIPVITQVSSPGTMQGFAVFNGSQWQTEVTDVTPPNGTFDSPGIALSPVMILSTPISSGTEFRFQELLSSGSQTPGKTFGSGIFPETNTTYGTGFQLGDYLGTDITKTGIEIGPFATRLYLRLANTQLYTMGMFGDSTVAMVQPIDAATNTSKEGVWFWANAENRTLSKNVRAYSYGQGTASWATIQERVRANLITMAGKITRVCIQVWTWNSGWTTVEEADAAWAEYLSLESEVKLAGFACSPMILHPYTTRNSAGQISAFSALKQYVLNHGEGLLLDNITGSLSWPNLPVEWSEDNVHMNQTGANAVSQDVASALRAIAAIDYPEFS